MVWQGWGGG
ncbi:hypothetical protein EC902281_5587, partial [Escherichia coli 90.2281]